MTKQKYLFFQCLSGASLLLYAKCGQIYSIYEPHIVKSKLQRTAT